MGGCNLDCLNCALDACIFDKKPEKVHEVDYEKIEGFNERLTQIMHTRHMGQSQLARKTGISVASISGYCKGARMPGCNQLYQICKALDTSSDYLLGL